MKYSANTRYSIFSKRHNEVEAEAEAYQDTQESRKAER